MYSYDSDQIGKQERGKPEAEKTESDVDNQAALDDIGYNVDLYTCL